MSEKTVSQLAKVVGIPLEQFLEQLKEAGLSASSADDVISEDEKMKLLAHLRKRHGKADISTESTPKRVTLKRRVVSELKQSSAPGTSSKTISVEVRKKKTYVKRTEVEDEAVESLQEKAVETKQPEPLVEQEAVEKKVVETELEIKKEEVSVEPEEVKVDEVKTEEAITEEPVEEVVPEPVETEEDKLEAERLALEEEEKRLAEEKAKRLQESIEKNAEKVRKQAAARQEAAGQKNKKAERQVKPVPKKGKKKGRQKEVSKVETDGKHQFEKPVAPTVREVVIGENIIVSDLAQKMSIKAAEVIKHLMKLGIMATINQTIDQETAAILVEEMGHKVIMQSDDDLEAEVLGDLAKDDRPLIARAPIVTIMGHVDHGKTSLLDYIRETRVAAGEAGGITQHIGAYQVKTDHGSVTFLDTPGHAAFTAMRARGAEVTDVVIVVVAADDGVMPQTKEAVEHARAANVPMIVAINKMDKPEANPDKVMQELAALDVVPEEWGGDVQFLKVSAKTGEGIDDLIEALILQAEILELKAPVKGIASGIVIESRLDKGRGPVATVLVQKGTLEKSQIVLCGHEYGRVRAMFNENAKAVKEAGPCAPVEILGLSGTPNAGDEFLVVQSEKAARDLAEHRQDRNKLNLHASQQAAKLDQVFSRMAAGETASLNLVIKTDVQGSLEALRDSLIKLSTEEVEVKVVFGGVGGINEGDANLALASGAILIGFNVRADATARKLIEEKEIDLHYYSVIYDAIDEVKKSISGMLAPEIKEQIVGLAEVRDVFRSPKFGSIAGCMVLEGFVKRNLPIRVLRDNVVIYEGQLESLRRFKDDANEVKMGMECGIGVKNYNDVRNGDQIEVFERIEVKREI